MLTVTVHDDLGFPTSHLIPKDAVRNKKVLPPNGRPDASAIREATLNRVLPPPFKQLKLIFSEYLCMAFSEELGGRPQMELASFRYQIYCYTVVRTMKEIDKTSDIY